MVEPGTKPAVTEALIQMGGRIINFAVSRTGLEVWADQPARVQENPEQNL
jgi:hypothetical protein